MPVAEAALPRAAPSVADLALLGVLLAVSAVVTWDIRRREAAGMAVVPGRPWPAASWNGLDVGACLGFVLVAVILVASAVGPDVALPLQIAASSVGFLLGTLAILVRLRAGGVSWRSIGLTSFDPAGDLRLAVAGLALVTGPLLVIAMFLDGIERYEHPVVKALAPAPDAVTIAVVAISAIIAAPITEELFFRRILLGWLDVVRPSPGGWVAVLVSSVAFGLAHWGQGLAWIPLVILGIVLGELARRRGSLVPAILLHGLFNAVSVLLLLLDPSRA